MTMSSHQATESKHTPILASSFLQIMHTDIRMANTLAENRLPRKLAEVRQKGASKSRKSDQWTARYGEAKAYFAEVCDRH